MYRDRELPYDGSAHGTGVEPVAECPAWGEWAREGASVKCRECGAIYTGRYEYFHSAHIGYKVVGGVPAECPSCAHQKAETARLSLPLDPAIIAEVRARAEALYNEPGGWDYIVESYTDEELWEVIADTTPAKAMKRAEDLASLLGERRRREVRSTEW